MVNLKYMIAFGHTAVGTLVGIYSYQLTQGASSNVALALPLGIGIVSHYITDFIPHGHFMGNAFRDFSKTLVGIIFFDLFLSLALFIGVAFLLNNANTLFFYILAGVVGSQLPDILDGLIGMKIIPKEGLFKKEQYFHQLIHWHGRGENGLIIGLLDIWQFAVVIFAMWVLVTI